MAWSGEDPAASEVSEDAAVESEQAETLSDGTTYLDWPSPFGFPAPLMDPRHLRMFALTLASLFQFALFMSIEANHSRTWRNKQWGTMGLIHMRATRR